MLKFFAPAKNSLTQIFPDKKKMDTSRVFVKGLPPTINEATFRKHFDFAGHVTDIKLIPHRRIGYVGYRSPEEATKAVKRLNRSFIRMSKISVEPAKPVSCSSRKAYPDFLCVLLCCVGVCTDVPPRLQIPP